VSKALVRQQLPTINGYLPLFVKLLTSELVNDGSAHPCS